VTPAWLRLGAALGLSALLHGAALLGLLALRAPAPPPGAGIQMNVLIVPLERAAPPAASAAAAAPRPARQKEAPDPKPRPDFARAPAPAEPAQGRRVSASVSAGPVSVPREAPASALEDAASYRPAENLRVPPQLAGQLSAHYPSQAFEQRRTAVVVLQLMVDEGGRVVEALPLPGPSEDFVAAAREALGGARFTPGEAAGRPVRSRVYFAVSFVIE